MPWKTRLVRVPRRAIDVAVGVVVQEQQLLLARRPEQADHGGLWEFPGGKLEVGESAQQALVRELREELAIEVTQSRPMIGVWYDYPDYSVLLHVFWVDVFASQPRSAEGQRWCWCAREALSQYRFPEANRAILATILMGQ